jgi:hypothetical protein
MAWHRDVSARGSWARLIEADGQPLIHMALAFELSSKTLAIEALAMACCRHDPNAVDDQSPDVSSKRTPMEILDLISKETTVDDSPDVNFRDHRRLLLKYRNSLDMSNAKELLEQLQRLAVSLLLCSMENGKPDELLSMLVASSHAVRVLLPLTPAKLQRSLLQQLWQLILAVCLVRSRSSAGHAPSKTTVGWKLVEEQACADDKLDAWTLAAIRATRQAAETWGDADGYFLAAATKLSAEA